MSDHSEPVPVQTVEDGGPALDFDAARSPVNSLTVGNPRRNEPASAPMIPAMRDNSPSSMLAYMVQQGADLDKIERMIALVHAEEDRSAKQTFDAKFAQMQAAFKPVPRDSKADFETKTGQKASYDYATIEGMVKTNGRAIADHGFSYHFTEELQEGGKVRRFYLHVDGWGHTRATFVELPEGGAGAPLMNAAQVSRSLQSYGQRYAMFAGFGFVTEGDDDDAKSLSPYEAITLAEEISLISGSTKETLRANYATAIQNKRSDQIAVLDGIKKEMVAKIQKADQGGSQ